MEPAPEGRAVSAIGATGFLLPLSKLVLQGDILEPARESYRIRIDLGFRCDAVDDIREKGWRQTIGTLVLGILGKREQEYESIHRSSR
jgi:hypothetical protein